MNDHPITPPPELVEQWFDASVLEGAITYDEFNFANLAARWGADMELEACCEWLREFHQSKRPGGTENLRRSRRPKPPRLKEQALAAQQRMWDGTPNHDDWNLIRRALEQLPDAHYSP
jgi:hypothetical protein